MKKLKSKYVVLVLNCPGIHKGEHRTVIPVVGEEVDKIIKRDNKFGFPSVFMMNVDTDKVLYACVGGWRDPSVRLREIRKALDGIDVTASDQKDEPKESGKEPEEKLVPEAWQNKEGKTINAIVLGVEGNKVVFKMSSGKKVRYPLDKLSDESRKKIEERFPK